jgi:Domain of unknown function (DUF4386)
MDAHRKTGGIAGILFIVAAAAAIAALALYHAVLNDLGYVLDAGRSDTAVLLGALFEVLTAIAVIGTATTLYPIVRRESEGLAISYVVGRLLEAALIVVGIISLLSIATLRQDAAGPDPSLLATGKALVALHDWTFLFGPGLAIGINTTLLATLMYRSRLVPRAIARIGLIGGPLVFASSVAILFGAYEQTSAVAALFAAPVFVWEMSLAGWMIAKGLKPSPARERLAAPQSATPSPQPPSMMISWPVM